MEQYDDGNNQGYNDLPQSSKVHQTRERGGLIPVTANILKEAEVTKEETVEYQSVPISDITAIGYVIDYKELEAKVKVTLYDYTGTMEINFFNKIDNQDSVGLNKFHYDGTKKPVQIFGTVKVFKNEKNIQGAKIVLVTCSDVLYHRADVIHAWLYLTGKLQELKENNIQNTADEAKKIAMGNRNTMPNNNNENEAVALLENYVKKENRNDISQNDINNLFKKFGDKTKDIINKLIDNNKLVDNDGNYEIM
jgi:hypothetical protein